MEIASARSATLQHNKDLATIFHKMADCYNYLGAENRFRARAYEVAARTLGDMRVPVDVYGHDVKRLEELNGVGESIAEKIIEYIDTGTIKTFEKLKKEVPSDLLELMDVSGIGASTLRTLHDTLNVNTKDDFIKALQHGKLSSVKGFGAKRIENLQRVLKVNKDESKRMLYSYALKVGEEMLRELRKVKGVIRAEIAGSLRRKKETIGDIDLVATAKFSDRKKIIEDFVQLPQVKRIQAKGGTKASVILKENDVQVDLRIVDESEFGAAMLYSTGSLPHTLRLRAVAKKKGWRISEYGLFDVKTGKRLAGETEEGVYKVFGLPYIPPEKRLGGEELDAIR